MTSSTSESAADDRLDQIVQIVNEIVRKTSGGGYIYRGETRCHEHVSSGLYREISETYSGLFDFSEIQGEIVNRAKRFTAETDEIHIVTQLQHYGDATNLIDFTTDLHIALFFACDGHPDEAGRVILLTTDESEVDARIFRPSSPQHRVLAQKSVFVLPQTGLIKPNDIVEVPMELKQPCLKFLRRHHGISRETIYNDLLGFIKFRQAQREAERQCNVGYGYHQNGDYLSAIAHYTKAIESDPQMFSALVNRSDAHCKIDDYKRAVQDADLAIEIYPLHPAPYNNRGNAYGRTGDLRHALADFNAALELEPRHYQALVNRGNAHAEMGSYSSAITDYDRAIDIGRNEATVYCHRGLAYAHRGDVDLAIDDFTQAIRLDSTCANAFTNRANAYIVKAKLDLAVADANEAISLDPEAGVNYYNQAVAFMGLAKWEEARDSLSKAISREYHIATTFLDDHESLCAFEEKYNVVVPDYIAVQLAAVGR